MKMIKKFWIFLSTLALLLVMAPLQLVGAVNGYQWIQGIPDDILGEKYSATVDELEAADEYFSDGALGLYPLIGFNCDGNIRGGSPDCEKYYYFAQDSNETLPTFTEFCVFIDSCSTGGDQLLVYAPDKACRQDGLNGTGGNMVCTSSVTINDPFGARADVEGAYDIDFDSLPEVGGVDEGVDQAQPEDPGGDEMGEEEADETEGDCDFGDGFDGILEIAKNPLDWFGCAVIKGLINFTESAESTINETLETDFDDSTQDGVKPVWDRFLNIANILFVIAFLIMVISTALNLGIFDAYTVKKLLPRIIIAVIIANLSFAICTVVISVVNTIGHAVPDIFSSFTESSSGTDLRDVGGDVIGATAGASLAAAAAIAAGALATAGVFAVVPMLLAVVMAVVIALVVVILRRVLIILLIVVAPLAIVMWALPGGEGLAKRWWKTFIQLMFVYPMILALIASGKLVASILAASAGSGNDSVGVFDAIAILGSLIIPFFMLPAVFKLATSTLGNITGRLNDRSKGLIDRSKKMRSQKMQQGWDRKYAPRVLSRRAAMTEKLQSSAAKRGRIAGGLMRAGARGVGGYNIEAAMSARNAQESKIINDQINTGKDDEIRALSVNKKAADRGVMASVASEDGYKYADHGLKRVAEDGTKEYKTLAGAWVNESHVDQANRRWGNNRFAQQASLSYEMRKAMEDDQVQDVASRYSSLATEQWGLNESQADGNWIGAAFENQNQHIEYKNTKQDYKAGKAVLNGNKLAREVYEKKGSYPLSQMSAHTITQLGNAHDEATARINSGRNADGTALTVQQRAAHQETINMVGAVAETFVQRGSVGGPQGVIDNDGELQPAPPQLASQQGTGAQETTRTYGSGAAHVNERINWLASKTGRFEGAPSAPHTPGNATGKTPGIDSSQSADPSPGRRNP